MKSSHYKAKFARTIIKFFDIFLVLMLFVYIREHLNFGHFVDTRTLGRIEFSLRHIIAMLMLAVLWNRILTYMGLYSFRQNIGFAREVWQVVLASSLGVATMLFGAGLIGITGIGREFSLVFWPATIAAFISYRSLLYVALYLIRSKSRNIRYVVIVGLNPRSISLFNEISRPELGMNVVGFVDDESRLDTFEDRPAKPLLCSLNEFGSYVSNYPVDEVLITLPIRSYYDEIARIIETCAKQGVKARLITDFFDLPSNIPCYIAGDSLGPALSYESVPLTELQNDVKRMVDIVLSLSALILLSPVLIVIGILMLIDDGWPVFFSQERVGLNKRHFKVFKFRTMVRDAEKMQAALEEFNEIDGAAFKITDDPRVTKVGRFLRRTSLDELPQFLNVLMGTMTLVGPRPLPLRDFENFYDDRHRRRFSVKPGITGLWQISGRSDVNFDEWMRLDLEYIDSWSFLLELKILVMTIPAVLTARGAK